MSSKFSHPIGFFAAFLLLLTISCQQSMPTVSSQNTTPLDHFPLSELSTQRINASLLLAGQWLLNNQRADGSLVYLYFPDSKTYSSGNNMIRQFMATNALAELYGYTGSEAFKQSFDHNMRFNFNRYYALDNGLGYITYNNEANLGAMSIALMATLHSEEYEDEGQHLATTILHLHNGSDGKFRTFHFPQRRDNDNQYFYSGEAMLALMNLHHETKDIRAINTVKRSFDFYSIYFEDKMNPAFIPWHTMANYHLYLETGNETYAEYIFRINDWLLTIQNKECQDPRHLGRFYDPKHTEYGPPHSSSDGVYVEGLSYAYLLAKMKNDHVRMKEYREGMLLGMRSILEMQFTPEESVKRSDASAVLGGFRVSTERSEIRVDNVQHSIMAMKGVLDTLSDEDIDAFTSTANYGCPPTS